MGLIKEKINYFEATISNEKIYNFSPLLDKINVSREIYSSKNNLYRIFFDEDNIPHENEILEILEKFQKHKVTTISIKKDKSTNQIKPNVLEYIEKPYIDDDEIIFFKELGYCLIKTSKSIIKNVTLEENNFLIEPDKVIKSMSTLESQETEIPGLGLDLININNTSLTGKNINVCIMDSGLSNHKDFEDRTIIYKSIIDNDTNDYFGHGTHCTGIACGGKNDLGERYGVAFESNIFICKVLDKKGLGMQIDLEKGLIWAINNGCKVVNISIGIVNKGNTLYDESFNRLFRQGTENFGCVFICAAGNDSYRPNVKKAIASPADCPFAIAVGAIDYQNKIYQQSNRAFYRLHQKMNHVALGVNVYSTWLNNLYKSLSGTSMATAYITGIVALLFEKFGDSGMVKAELEKMSINLSNLKTSDIGKGLPKFSN